MDFSITRTALCTSVLIAIQRTQNQHAPGFTYIPAAMGKKAVLLLALLLLASMSATRYVAPSQLCISEVLLRAGSSLQPAAALAPEMVPAYCLQG